jgi:Cu(I)/Ag(I) efflux system membrane protein CusA/SilA
MAAPDIEPKTALDKLIYFCLSNKLVVLRLVVFTVLWGIMVAPFDWKIDWLPRDPVAVDAIPDIGENQQIVFTKWMGRSPQDVEDQVSYPLTVSMLGIPGVKTVRSYSMMGFSTIYVIFEEDVDFYWSRSRVLEKLSSLPAGSMPPGVKPMLGPDATALGQVYWYTLEGRDEAGNPTGGWDLHELRSIQDWYVRYALLSANGISEVASVGGFVRECQIDVDPEAMRIHGVTLEQVFMAVKNSNLDVGARTIEINKAEYVVRGLGFIESLADVENTVVKAADNVPVYLKQVATVSLGPAERRGALDKGGAEAVGGVAVVRYGENPLAAIKNLKGKIKQVSPGLPEKVIIDHRAVSDDDLTAFANRQGFQPYRDGVLNQEEWLQWAQATPAADRPGWATLSKVTIVPFYDRTGLIYETLGTLQTALTEEMLITIIVIIIMLMHLRSSFVISMTLPLEVLMCFIAMKIFSVDADIVALSGIAIAIGTIVDMGVIVCENILKHLDAHRHEKLSYRDSLEIVYRATSEVGSAVLTAILTTVVSFLPVFTMIGAEGKLFKPLAFTKTYTLIASVIVALTIVPAMAHLLFTWKVGRQPDKKTAEDNSPASRKKRGLGGKLINFIVAGTVGIILTNHWMPLGPGAGFFPNLIVVVGPIAALLGFFTCIERVYPRLLRTFLAHKLAFLCLPLVMLTFGLATWLGANTLFGWLPDGLRQTRVYSSVSHAFPGLGKEFMPDLDEGSFLYMPTTMPHASIGEAMDSMRKQDLAFAGIPEVESVVGKLGRADTPLDPAPVSMFETVINYKPEYVIDDSGHRLRFEYDAEATDLFRDQDGTPLNAPDGSPYVVRGAFARDENRSLIRDEDGMVFRLWRPAMDPDLNDGREAWPGILSPDDIWDEIVRAGEIPGTTSAPRLQPIAARIVMLQSGMRAPMGLKVRGPDLATIEAVGMQMEALIKEVPGVQPAAVLADRIVGKPYLEIDVDRAAIARYGLSIKRVQDAIEIAIGGKTLTTTVEGRERYAVRVRYQRERRDTIDDLGGIIVSGMSGQQVPLRELAKINYVRGPQAIKSEDTFLVGYVLLDKLPGYAEVDVVEACQNYLQAKIDDGTLVIPAGVSYEFAGSYQNQLRAAKTLAVVLPLSLFIIFLILYFQFKSIPTTLLVFSGIAVAWAGGFMLIWFYGQPWFLNFSIFGTNLRDLFQISPMNLSVAVWVGFLALFGIATDDGVVMATYLTQTFDRDKPVSRDQIRDAVVSAGCRRVRPCLITTATTLLALIPVLTSTGRGADVMVPMAIPSFGGMLVALITMFVVPVYYCAIQEFRLKTSE